MMFMPRELLVLAVFWGWMRALIQSHELLFVCPMKPATRWREKHDFRRFGKKNK